MNANVALVSSIRMIGGGCGGSGGGCSGGGVCGGGGGGGSGGGDGTNSFNSDLRICSSR
jgi:hypothetical protein